MQTKLKLDFDSIIVFTDGACTGNPGPGGWGAVVAFPEGKIRELGGKESETTNNRMELMASIRALSHLNAIAGPIKVKGEAGAEGGDRDRGVLTSPIILYTDSTYVIRGITQWIWGWRQRGWRNAEGAEVSNRDLWEELLRQVTRLKPVTVEWKYVRGHTGVPGNERCDEIAVSFATGKWVDLYDGPLIQYKVAIHDLPEDQDLPPMRPKEKKAPAFSYLSYQGGVVMRHSTWADCERRVKGQSQAKFKKAMNEREEGEILKSWGLNPEKVTILE